MIPQNIILIQANIALINLLLIEGEKGAFQCLYSAIGAFLVISSVRNNFVGHVKRKKHVVKTF